MKPEQIGYLRPVYDHNIQVCGLPELNEVASDHGWI